MFRGKSPEKFLEMQDASVWFDPAFASIGESLKWQDQLGKETPWRQENIRMFGRMVPQPRLVAWYGDPGLSYTYSGLTLEPLPWTATLTEVRDRVEEACGTCFNSVLLNLYRTGADSMGWHSDDEPELGENPVIASVSLGEKRKFHFRHRFNPELPRIHLELTSGSLLLMQGTTQHYWHHQVPKTRRNVSPRINLTFRRIYDGVSETS